MTRETFTFWPGEPSGNAYRELLKAALLANVAHLGLIEPDRSNWPASAVQVREHLKPDLIASQRVRAWPGTELLDGYAATRYLINFSEAVRDIMLNSADGILDWENPHLLDDPHLLRDDGTVWFAGIPHGQDAWLELDADEWQALQDDFPALAQLVRRDDISGN